MEEKITYEGTVTMTPEEFIALVKKVEKLQQDIEVWKKLYFEALKEMNKFREELAKLKEAE